MRDKLKELMADIRELIEGYVDIKDGENGPLPNDAMRATQLLDELSALLQAPAGELDVRALVRQTLSRLSKKGQFGDEDMAVIFYSQGYAAGRSSQLAEPRDQAAK